MKLEAGPALDIVDADPLRALTSHLENPLLLTKLAAGAAGLLLHKRGRREGSTVAAELLLGDYGKLLLSVEAADLGKLLESPGAVTATLSLDDSRESRASGRFEASWRQWLRAWNLLQHGLPMASVLFSQASVGALVVPLMLFHQLQLMACAWLAQRYAARSGTE
jgi:hypothetical protein